MKFKLLLAAALYLLLLLIQYACNQSSNVANETQATDTLVQNQPTISDGSKLAKLQSAGVEMVTIDDKFKVWTRRIGGESKIKLLLLHGGPALTHEYLECFADFLPQEGIQVIEYDQLGSYHSDQPNDTSLWKTERFVEEVEAVRKALNLTNEDFYILGNSWGGILAIEYALKYQQNLKGVIISNMTASIPKYEKYNTLLRSKMRPSLIDSINQFEANEDYHNPVYQELIFNEYYTKHICRLEEWPEAVNRSFSHINQEIYELMQGPSEFKVGGRLLTWDRWNDLDKIGIPTLMIGAKYDTMNPEEMKEMSNLVQKGAYLYCPNGSHLAMWDDQDIYMKGVIDFLKAVDEGKFL